MSANDVIFAHLGLGLPAAMQAAEAESWDADFAEGAAGKEERSEVLLPARLRERAAHQGHEVDEDWDADFDGAFRSEVCGRSSYTTQTGDEAPPLQVKGRTADRIDPGAQDSEWTDDFAWAEGNIKSGGGSAIGGHVAKAPSEFDPAEKFQKRRKTDAASHPASPAPVVLTARERTVVRLKELLPAIPEPVLSDDTFLRSARPDPTLDMLLPPPLSPDVVLAFGEQLHVLQELATSAAQRADKAAEASARNDLSVLYGRAGRAAEAARESEAVAASMTGGIGRPGWEAVHNALVNAARASSKAGDNTAAVEYALKALSLAEEREASGHAGACHQLLGTLLYSSDPDAAVLHFAAHLKAACLAAPTERKGWRELGVSCWHAARLLQGMGETDLAEKYAGRAVDSATKARDTALFSATSSLYDALVALRGGKARVDEKEEVEWGNDWDAELAPMIVEPAPAKDGASAAATAASKRMSVAVTFERTESDGFGALGKARSDVTIVKYPAPTLLYSLRANEGHRLFSEERQEEWLSSLLSRHPRALTLLSVRRLGASQVPRKTDTYQRRASKYPRNNPEVRRSSRIAYSFRVLTVFCHFHCCTAYVCLY